MSQRRWRSQDLEGWFILSRMPNSSHMSIKPFDGWSADSLIYGALKSDTRSMGCSCGKSSLSQRALNQRARVDQLHEGKLRYGRLFSSARVHKEEVIGRRYSTQECWSYLEIPSKHRVSPDPVLSGGCHNMLIQWMSKWGTWGGAGQGTENWREDKK